MRVEIDSPAKEYNKHYKRHNENVISYYDDIVKKSNINLEENNKTCDKLYLNENKLEYENKKLNRTNSGFGFAFVLVILLLVISFISGITLLVIAGKNGGGHEKFSLWLSLGIVLILLGSFFIWLTFFTKRRWKEKSSRLKNRISILENVIKELKNQALEQMRPLNELFVWHIPAKLFEKTIPFIKMDTSFLNKDFNYLKKEYSLSNNFLKEELNKSTLAVQAGNILGNPFVILKERREDLIDILYTGSKIITYTQTYHTEDGIQTEVETETLYASVVAPGPSYYNEVSLIYANKAAPNLNFSRSPRNLKLGEKGSRKYERVINKEYRKLNKLEEQSLKQAKGDGVVFQTISNPEFEVLFYAINRTSELEYRVLFTPLAQRAMIDLLLNKTYGDYFTFLKYGVVNKIIPHIFSTDLFDVGPKYFYNIDNRLSRKKFIDYNMRYFKTIYYMFAPILTIPIYKENKDINFIYNNNESNTTIFEQETLANSLPQSLLRGSYINTKLVVNILNNEKINENLDKATLLVKGYKKVPHEEIVNVMASNGISYGVPVKWFEYVPYNVKRDMYIYQNTESKNIGNQILQNIENIRNEIYQRRNFSYSLSNDFEEKIKKGYKLHYISGSGRKYRYDYSYNSGYNTIVDNLFKEDYQEDYFNFDM